MTDEQTLGDVATQAAETAAALRSLSGDVSEFAAQQVEHGDELKRLDAHLRTVAGLVEELAEAVEQKVEDESDLAPVDWSQLDAEAAAEQWRKLHEWFARIADEYEVRRDQVPDCWTRHKAMRNELSWLRTVWCYAYFPSAVSGAAAEWHLRHLPGALDRIAAHAVRPADEAQRCVDGSCRGALIWDQHPPIEAFGQVTRPDVWCTDGVDADLAARPAPTPNAADGQ